MAVKKRFFYEQVVFKDIRGKDVRPRDGVVLLARHKDYYRTPFLVTALYLGKRSGYFVFNQFKNGYLIDTFRFRKQPDVVSIDAIKRRR